jgi:hypothetical protein
VRYVVWSYDYSHASAGPKVLHRLCHELNQIGQEAYIGNGYATNPEWDTPHGEVDADTTAIYPEIVTGNPWNAPRVVRWVLNTPGRLGGDRTYPASEQVFTYSPLFADAPLLYLPAVEMDIYADRGLPREGALIWAGKSRVTRHIEGRAITHAMRLDRYALADALNRAEVLYSFDTMSGMIDVARMCGCPVVVVPDGAFTYDDYDREIGWEGIGWDTTPAPWDPAHFRASYLAKFDTFRSQLARFVEITSGVRV